MSKYAIQSKFPATNPDAIQLYSFPTPNGIKISWMLEETGLGYEAHPISIMKGDQMTPQFLEISPNNKIPAIIDPNGPNGEPLALFESGAILMYLAEKSGKFLSTDPAERMETIQWLMWQMGGAGPMFGQFGFFYRMGGKDWEDKRPLERYSDESKRLLAVLDKQLAGHDYIVGDDFSIADMAVAPWIATLDRFYQASEHLDLPSFTNISAWIERCTSRPALKIAQKTPSME